jgi:CheY-like chemotaxis protein
VLEAANAAEAAGILDGGPRVDLVFTDIVMPGAMDGRALGRWALRHHPGVKVLLTSGFADQAAAARADGVDELPFVAKPYSEGQLRTAVRALLRGQAA